jgi:hypothetical protein
MKHLLLFFFLNLLIGCNQPSTCRVDKEFSEKFNNCLDYIKETEHRGEFLVEKRLNAMKFLSVVTNKESSIDDPHHPKYQSKEEFDLEVKHWEDWYLNNKCKYTIVEADSLVSLYNNGRLKLELK